MFWAERKTARFCDGTCRQRHNRGKEPVPYWESETQWLTDFLAMVADNHPQAFQKLEAVQGKYGQRGLRDFVAILQDFV